MSALGIHDLGLFIIAGLVLNLTPGPDMLLIIGRSTAQGFRAGAATAFGIAAGCVVHTLAVAVGLAAVLATSATAFAAIKWLGAAYLVYLGVQALRARADSGAASPLIAVSLRTAFTQGFFTNVFNPKVALFFLALLPQFVSYDAPHAALGLALLGLVFIVNSLPIIVPIAWLAARAGAQLMRRADVQRWMNRALGAVFLFLAVRLVLSERD